MAKGKMKIWDIFQIILKPERCKICNEFMDVFKTWDDTHETIERKCKCTEDNK